MCGPARDVCCDRTSVRTGWGKVGRASYCRWHLSAAPALGARRRLHLARRRRRRHVVPVTVRVRVRRRERSRVAAAGVRHVAEHGDGAQKRRGDHAVRPCEAINASHATTRPRDSIDTTTRPRKRMKENGRGDQITRETPSRRAFCPIFKDRFSGSSLPRRSLQWARSRTSPPIPVRGKNI